MKREFLENLGLEKEAIDKAMAEHGKSIEAQKTKVTDLTASNEDLQEQIKQRDNDLKALKKQADGNENLQKEFADLQEKYNTEKANYEQKLKDNEINSALKLALAGKVHDADLTLSLINRESIVLDAKGEVKGLQEQVKTLKESKPFLFVEEAAAPPKPKGATPKEGKPQDNLGGETSIGSTYAQQANAKGTTGDAPSLWG